MNDMTPNSKKPVDEELLLRAINYAGRAYQKKRKDMKRANAITTRLIEEAVKEHPDIALELQESFVESAPRIITQFIRNQEKEEAMAEGKQLRKILYDKGFTDDQVTIAGRAISCPWLAE